jgi:hypothetical protein
MFNQMTRGIRRAQVRFLLKGLFATLCFATRFTHADPVGQETDFIDPIFGLSYSAQSVNFDYAGTGDLLRGCSNGVKNARLPPRIVVFASYENPHRKIYIVGDGDDSALFLIQDEKCSSGIPLLALSQTYHAPPDKGDAPVLSKDEVSGLFQNALERYTRAFGGKGHFLQWLDVTSERMRSGCKGLPNLWCPPTYHSLPADLQAALAAYRNGISIDPIFNLPFDRAGVHFEALQSSLLLPQCKKLLLDYPSMPEKLTVYARHQNASAEIFIAGSEENVAIYVIRGDRCEVGVPSLALVGGHNDSRWTPPRDNQPALSSEEASSLFSDALFTYTKAFGGKEVFLKWLDDEHEKLSTHCNEKSISCPPTYRSLSLNLLKILSDYRAEQGPR